MSFPRIGIAIASPPNRGLGQGTRRVSRFDRYLLSQLLALFGFFSLVMVGIYWVNRAVLLFDQLIGDGQSALVFLEFSLLALPNAIRLVLPVSAFAASVYVANRLMQDSELVVMQATGFSSVRLARPVFVFGLIVAMMMLVLTNFLVPASRSMLAERSDEIAENITARFLVDGRFMHPAKGLTLYIREITPEGELLDLLMEDSRNVETHTTYLARRAVLLKSDTGPKLIMIDGQSQHFSVADRRLAITRFQDFTYDLGAMMTVKKRKGRSADELSTLELLRASEAVQQETRADRSTLLLDGHSRIAQPFLATASALIGFASLLVGAFSRFGLWRQILGAILLLIVVQLINTSATGAAARSAGSWPAVYVAPVVGLAIAGALLWWSQRPRRVPRSQGAAA